MAILGRSESSVRWVLAGCKRRPQCNRNRGGGLNSEETYVDVSRKFVIDPKIVARGSNNGKVLSLTGGDIGYIDLYVPKPIRKVINQNAIAEATRLFAAEKITIDEMLARIDNVRTAA